MSDQDQEMIPEKEWLLESQWPRKDVKVDLIEAARGFQELPVQPVRLTPKDGFHFSCHAGLGCWNHCCHGADITLTPNCILRLSAHFAIRPAEFLTRHTVPAMWGKALLPVAKLKMGGDDGRGPCPFMRDEGCSVYADRPVTCRYYPLGLASMKMKDAPEVEDFNFLVKEPHCRGHDEAREQTVGQFRAEQGIEEYDIVNRGWMDILMKMASWASVGGPWGQKMTPQTQKMFFMVSTDVDAFRRFVFGTRFLETYDVAAEIQEAVRADDRAALGLGFDWMKNVLFNEPTITFKDRVLMDAIAKARTEMGAA